MALSEREVLLLRESFDALGPDLEDASVTFYARFFARAPELRGFFRTDLQDQGMRFMSAVGTILDRFGAPDGAGETIARLGEGHAALGVRPDDFKPMRAALIETFGHMLGERFTDAHAAAWGKAFDEIAGGMIATGRAVEPPTRG
ncbi:MAG TPA: globin domain-containing protein [Thermohalobaculum sp.]|nr:globin domain-containing protein [Thermohalobaculum sp.]